MKKYNVDFGLFSDPTKMVPESVYVLGLLWSDGHVAKNTSYVSITGVSEDFDLLQPFVFVGGEWGVYYRQQTPNRKPQTTFGVTNKQFHAFLVSMGYLTKSFSSACKILSFIPESLRLYWWRGYFDGDGCIYTNKNYQCFFTGSLETDWTFLKFLPSNIHWKHIKKDTSSGSYSRMLSNRKADIIAFGDYIYGGNTRDFIGLERKKSKFESLKASPVKFRGTGISLHVKSGRWVARFRHDKVWYYLGYFTDKDDAINAVSQKRAELMLSV